MGEQEKGSFVWCFNTEEGARACVALMASGDNVERWTVSHGTDGDGWDLRVELDEYGVAWARGFACAFARLTPNEASSDLVHATKGAS